MWSREFVKLQFRYLLSCCPTIEFSGMSTGKNELVVDGLLANVGIGIVPLFRSSSFAKELPVPIACGTDSFSLWVSCDGEFLDDDFETNQMKKIDYQKRFPVFQTPSMYQMANVCRGSAWNENLESLVDWKRKTTSRCDLIPLLEIHLNLS